MDTGRLLRESAWGSGVVNGVSTRRCLRVAEYEWGWMFQTTVVFGGGRLWLPRSLTQIGVVNKGGVLCPPYRTINCGKDSLRLTGNLADFFAEGD